MGNTITECGMFKDLKLKFLEDGLDELMAHNIAFMILYPVWIDLGGKR